MNEQYQTILRVSLNWFSTIYYLIHCGLDDWFSFFPQYSGATTIGALYSAGFKAPTPMEPSQNITSKKPTSKTIQSDKIIVIIIIIIWCMVYQAIVELY